MGAGQGRRRSSGAGGGAELEDEGEDTGGGTGGGKGESLSRPRAETKHNVDRHRERTLMGSLTNNYKFKADGLMKKVSYADSIPCPRCDFFFFLFRFFQTFSLAIAGVAQHLISYYKVL
jgi:hypothetical protein